MPNLFKNIYNENARNKAVLLSDEKLIRHDGPHARSKASVRAKRPRNEASRYTHVLPSKIARTLKQGASLDHPKKDQALQPRQPNPSLHIGVIPSQDESTKESGLQGGPRLGSSSHFFASVCVSSASSQAEVTLGDGNCLYNGVALGIRDNKDLQASLIECLVRLDFKAFRNLNPHSSLSALYIEGISLQRKRRQLSDFLTKTLALSSVALQECLAPILRFIAVSYLQRMRGRPGVALYDAAILESIASEYQRDRRHRDAMHLLYHDFIRAKLNALIKEVSSSDVPKAFAQWFEQEGKLSYFDAIKRPAIHARDEARWSAETELDALARALNTNMTWEKNGIRGLVGILAGIVPVLAPGRSPITQAVIDKLVRLDIAEKIGLEDNIGHITEYLRFMPQAGAQLAQHEGAIMLPGSGDIESRIQMVFDGCQAAQAAEAKSSELTVYDYLSQRLGRPDIALCYKARGILTDSGRFITNEQGKPDVARIAILAQGLTRGEVAMVNRFIQPVISSLTLHNNEVHWSYVFASQALVSLSRAYGFR